MISRSVRVPVRRPSIRSIGPGFRSFARCLSGRSTFSGFCLSCVGSAPVVEKPADVRADQAPRSRNVDPSAGSALVVEILRRIGRIRFLGRETAAVPPDRRSSRRSSRWSGEPGPSGSETPLFRRIWPPFRSSPHRPGGGGTPPARGGAGDAPVDHGPARGPERPRRRRRDALPQPADGAAGLGCSCRPHRAVARGPGCDGRPHRAVARVPGCFHGLRRGDRSGSGVFSRTSAGRPVRFRGVLTDHAGSPVEVGGVFKDLAGRPIKV